MGADTVALGIPGGGGAGGADCLSGRSPVTRPAPGPSGSSGGGARDGSPTSTSSSGTRQDGGAARASSRTTQTGGASADGSSASGTGSAGSSSSEPKPAGKSDSAGSGNASGGSGPGPRRSAAQGSGASATSSAGAAQTAAQGTAQAAAAAGDFSAALAHSLAAIPGDGKATTDISAGKAAAKSDSADSSAPSKGNSTADPVSSALTLLQQAFLAGALAGAPAASTNSTPATGSSTIAAAGKSSTATLDALLTQNIAPDSKGAASNPTPAAGSATPAAPAAAASSGVAALTAAAQLSSAAHLGSQPGVIDSSRMTLASPVGTSAWTNELGTKVTWMASQGIQSASLQLSPEHLGPLQVSISVHNGQASVWFGAAQPDTRAALQQSLPQLRQLFASQGLNLADAGVSREPPRGQGGQSSARSAAPVSGITAVDGAGSDSRTASMGGLGLLDTYA